MNGCGTKTNNCSPGCGIGRHKGLKIPRSLEHDGSSPSSGTILKILVRLSQGKNRELGQGGELLRAKRRGATPDK